MRILGLDYGSKRIGVALCDELGITAQGLTTLVRKNWRKDLEAIAELVKMYDVEMIVIGYPLRLNGTRSTQCEKIDRFATLLEAACSVPVVKYDEAFSTQCAEEILSQARVRSHRRRRVIDKLAASIILQGYLDSRQRERK